jgi:hypothetical protein
MRSCIRVVVAYVGSALALIAVSFVIDPEMVPASLLVSLFVLPSVALYVIAERSCGRFRTAKDIVFGLSTVPLSAGMIFVGVQGGEASEMATFIGVSYIVQALVAYLLLLISGGNYTG